jgi:uncharacterized protein YjbI with pentapeptide repeats
METVMTTRECLKSTLSGHSARRVKSRFVHRLGHASQTAGRLLTDISLSCCAALSFIKLDILGSASDEPLRKRAMANPDHLNTLRQGVDAWNAWRKSDITPDLSDADLRGAYLSGADLSEADLSGAELRNTDLTKANLSRANLTNANLGYAILRDANVSGAHLDQAALRRATLSGVNLTGAHLSEANLRGASLSGARLTQATLRDANLRGASLTGVDLSGATLRDANLRRADLSGGTLPRANLSRTDLSEATLRDANLSGAYLIEANLSGANLVGANLVGANLAYANLVDADLTGANLTGCRIYGVSAWGLNLSDKTKQRNLIITREGDPEITVDDIEVAQFIYLLLNNAKIRNVIDTITSKAVLILGRFTAERKAVLDALRDELRKRDHLPILFDFDKPTGKDLTGTVTTLANMVRFIVADGTDPKSIPHELATIVPTTIVPVKPILLASEREYAMFGDLQRRYHWVLPTYRYERQEQLIADLDLCVIQPAAKKAEELRKTVSA